MTSHEAVSGRAPEHVAVVGGGIIGLATAWFLLERGVEVTVLERGQVGAGASWGNAGWLAPALTMPLPEPAVLRGGPRMVLDPSSPVYVPLRADVQLARFLLGFARHCTTRSWERAMASYAPLSRQALEAYRTLADDDAVPAPRPAEPFLLGFADDASRADYAAELDHVARFVDVRHELLTGAQARALSPALSTGVAGAIRLHDQQFVDPPRFVAALADAVVARGGKLRERAAVVEVRDDGRAALVRDEQGEEHRVDAVVLASGAHLGRLAEPFGVRRLVQAGRGYSFSVPCRELPRGPLYFPAQRVACTPLETAAGPRLRVAGMMEFRAPDEPLDPRRVRAIVEAVRPMLDGADLDDRRDEWVGSRPCTTDGLPLVGATTSPRVFVAGGHGMWGMVLGPLTGRLIAEQVVTGTAPAELAPLDPLR